MNLKTIYKKTKNHKTNIKLSWQIIKQSIGLQPNSMVSVQFVRSLVVSVIALVFDFGLLVILKQKFGVEYLLAATISFTVGVIVNYWLSIWWVFPDHKLDSKHAEFAIFVIINIIGLGLNLIIIGALVQLAAVDYRYAKVVSTVIVFFWNFVARKKVLF